MENQSKKMKKLAVIPGDGIGKEVIAEAIKVLEQVDKAMPFGLDLVMMPWGADHFLKTNVTIPPEQFDDFRENYDAILMGAFGDPRVPSNVHAKDILLGTRFELDLYVNYRPIKLLADKFCPLKSKGVKDIDIEVFRENTEGVYVGVGGNFKKNTPDEIAIQEEINTRKGVERIIRYAFEFSVSHSRKTVTMADKSNAMEFGHDLWTRCFSETAAEYPDIKSKHAYIDALAMTMVKSPESLDVIVTNNLFGDIITDLGAQLQGGMGMAASGNINPNGLAMFEPVHGSAPDIAGQGIANPVAAILSCEMMLRYFKLERQADAILQAVKTAVAQDKLTTEMGGVLTTTECTDFICSQLAG